MSVRGFGLSRPSAGGYIAPAVDIKAKSLIRDVPDFPKPGILFKDITPVLQHPDAFKEVIDLMAEAAKDWNPTVVMGIESRGFIFGAPLALKLGLPFTVVRKLGKLPYHRVMQEYSLEYGTATIEMHEDGVNKGDRVLVVDDLIATGGTAKATAALIEKMGAEVAGFCFLVELSFLPGREMLSDYHTNSLITY